MILRYTSLIALVERRTVVEITIIYTPFATSRIYTMMKALCYVLLMLTWIFSGLAQDGEKYSLFEAILFDLSVIEGRE